MALPLLDAMVPALTAQVKTPARSAVRRLGVVYHPNGVIYENWLPKAWPRLQALAHARAARAVPRSVDRRDGSLQSSGGSARRRRRRSLARVRVVSDRRAREEVGQRRRERRLDGPDCGQGVREGDAAVVAAADRGRQQPGRVVRRRLQLRVQQHAVVADADAAADGRKQPARGLRAAVRLERQHGRARAARVCARTAAFSIRSRRA